VDAFKDRPAGLPDNLAKMIAEQIAPGSKTAAGVADAIDLTVDLVSGRMPVAKIPSNFGSALPTTKLASFQQVKNYENAAELAAKAPGVSVVKEGVAPVTNFLDALQLTSTINTASDYVNFADNGSVGAGGFLIYPNKSNFNLGRSVYSK